MHMSSEINIPMFFYLFLQQYCFKNIQDQTRSNEKKNLLVSVIHF